MTEPLDFGRIDPVYRAWAADYLRLSGFDAASFLAVPQPAEDEMFFKALLPNFEGDRGIGAFKFVEATMRHYEALRQIVEQSFGGFDGVGSLLDFASGYGRLTRALLQRMPAERIWVSDIYAEAIDWQVRNFGVNGFASAPDPAALAHDRKHDLIFVGSLFSHLPADLFRAWLARLHGMLTPRGVLAFSVHDQSILPAGEVMDETGIRFFPWSESGSLDPAIYGMTYVTEAFVADAIGDVGPEASPSWRVFHKGLYENQALYVVGGSDRDLSALSVASPPMGGFEQATLLTDSSVEFSGWAIERTPGQTLALAVHVADRPVGMAQALSDRPDVQPMFPASPASPFAWRFRLGRAEAGADTAIRLTLRSTSGLETHTFARMPSDPALTYSGWSRRSLPPL
jgi:SAM-dependent methyltransferase